MFIVITYYLSANVYSTLLAGSGALNHECWWLYRTNINNTRRPFLFLHYLLWFLYALANYGLVILSDGVHYGFFLFLLFI